MCISDMVVAVRASRTLHAEQVACLERVVFAGTPVDRHLLDLLRLLDLYAERADPTWERLLRRAVDALPETEAMQPLARAA